MRITTTIMQAIYLLVKELRYIFLNFLASIIVVCFFLVGATECHIPLTNMYLFVRFFMLFLGLGNGVFILLKYACRSEINLWRRLVKVCMPVLLVYNVSYDYFYKVDFEKLFSAFTAVLLLEGVCFLLFRYVLNQLFRFIFEPELNEHIWLEDNYRSDWWFNKYTESIIRFVVRNFRNAQKTNIKYDYFLKNDHVKPDKKKYVLKSIPPMSGNSPIGAKFIVNYTFIEFQFIYQPRLVTFEKAINPVVSGDINE